MAFSCIKGHIDQSKIDEEKMRVALSMQSLVLAKRIYIKCENSHFLAFCRFFLFHSFLIWLTIFRIFSSENVFCIRFIRTIFFAAAAFVCALIRDFVHCVYNAMHNKGRYWTKCRANTVKESKFTNDLLSKILVFI